MKSYIIASWLVVWIFSLSSDTTLVPIRSLLQWFFGEAIINTLTEFYDEASMTHLRATVNYWFTFREPSVDTQQVPTCLGCTRRANLVHELTGASFIKFDRQPVLDS